jgi:hypothetical protein
MNRAYVTKGWDRLKLGINVDAYLQLKFPTYPNPTTITYLLFNDAQDTYEDEDLWNGFLKDIRGMNWHVVLFCSYGSPEGHVVEHTRGTPLNLRNSARMSLRPQDEIPGLLLTRDEYNDVVRRLEDPVNLDQELHDLIFYWTEGHVGAVEDMFEMISHKVSVFCNAPLLLLFTLLITESNADATWL